MRPITLKEGRIFRFRVIPAGITRIAINHSYQGKPGVLSPVMMFLLLSLLVFFTLFAVTLLAADDVYAEALYGYRGKGGTVTFTTRKPKAGQYWRVKTPRIVHAKGRSRLGSRRRRHVRPRPSSYDSLITRIGQKYNVEPALVKAVVHAESSFNPRAKSPKGARGLMQLMPATASRFGVSNSWSPLSNLIGGTKYLSWLLTYFRGDVKRAVAGYNAGEHAVDRYAGIPPYPETQNYVRKVLKLQKLYRCDLAGRGRC